MALIKVGRARAFMPQGFAEVDVQSRLMQGVDALVKGDLPFNLIANKLATFSANSPTFAAGQYGMARVFARATSAKDSYPATPQTGDLTFMLVGRLLGTLAGTQVMGGLSASTTKRLWFGENGNSRHTLVAQPSGGSQVTIAEASNTVGAEVVLIARVSGTTLSFWMNGGLVGTASLASANFSDLTDFHVGWSGFLENPGSFTYLQGYWRRAFSDDEILAVSLNPALVFRDEQLVGYQVGGGGTTYTATLAAAVSAIAAAIRMPALFRTGAAAGSAAVVKVVSAAKSAASGAVCGLVRAPALVRSAVTSAGASLATLKARLLTLLATVGASATMVRAISATKAAASPLAPVISKAVSATKSASTSCSTALATLKAKLLTLSATVGTSATVRRSVGAVRAAATAGGATLARAVSITRAAAVVVSPLVQRLASLRRLATVSTAASVAMTKVKLLVLLAATSTVAWATRSTSKVVGAATSLATTVGRLVIASGLVLVMTPGYLAKLPGRVWQASLHGRSWSAALRGRAWVAALFARIWKAKR